MKHLLKIVLLAGLLVALFALTLTGCNKQEGCQEQSDAPLANTNIEPLDQPVARIVFVDKRFACDCTQKKIDVSLAALEKTLPTDDSIPIETIHYDTQREAAEPYIKQKPLMVIPAIYFLDDQDQVVKMLQGEVSEEVLTQILGGTS